MSASRTEHRTLSTESLIVELDARTSKLDAKLKGTNEKLDDLTNSSEKADSGLKKMGGAAKVAGSLILKTAAGALALSAAVTTMVLSAASSRKELEQLSRQAKTNTEDFKSLSFATSQFGVNAEQIADITKDISDRVGEFVTAGTGTFQDLGDALKLTKEETRALAIEFQDLSGEQVISRVSKDLEEAGVSGDQMTAVFEALGNDLSKLKPLFADNSKELIKLKTRFKDVNDNIQITSFQAEKLKDVSTTFGLLTSSFGNASTAISATLAPVLDDFFNDVIEVVPEATQTIIDFVNSFLSAENITSVSAATKRVTESAQDLATLQRELVELEAKRRRTSGLFDSSRVAQRAKQQEIDDEKELLLSFQARLAVLQEIEKVEAAKIREGGKIGGETGAKIAPLVMPDDEQKKIDALRQFIMTRSDLLDAQLLADIERLELATETFGLKDEELYARRLELVREFNENKLNLVEETGEKEIDNSEKVADSEVSLKRQSTTAITSILSSLVGESDSAGKALFLLSKGLAFSEAFVNTQAASVKALTIDPTGILSAKVQLAGNLSMAAIAASAFGVGGGGGGGGGGGVPPTPQQAPEPVNDFNDQGATVTDISGGEQTSQRIIIEMNDEFVDVMSRAVQKSQSDGRT